MRGIARQHQGQVGPRGAFSGDDNGRLVQNIFVGKYATAQDFAKDYLDMWASAYNAAKQ